MNTLYIDCRMGVSGAKLLGALMDTLENPELFVRRFNELGFEGIRMERQPDAMNGITGSTIVFRRYDDDTDPYADEIDENDEAAIEALERKRREMRHKIRKLSDVRHIIDDLPVSGKIRKRAIGIYENIAKASADSSGRSYEQVHLNRTGSKDIIASVIGVCMLFEQLDFEKIIVSPIATGTGYAMTSRGNMPIPIPALEKLLEGLPYLSGSEEGEICTLEGAAILREFADSFEDMPEITVLRSGAGFGQRTFKNGVNCVRIYIGNVICSAANTSFTELEALLKSETNPSLTIAAERIKEVGASDIYTMPVSFPSGGSGLLLRCICDNDISDKVAGEILRSTSARIVRRSAVAAYEPTRTVSEHETSIGTIRVYSAKGFGNTESQPIEEDVMRVARANGLSYDEALKIIIKEI